MQNEVLQVAIGRAHGAAEPRRNEDAHGRQTVRMDVEESENLRLREAERMENRSCLQPGIFRKLDHHFHAQRPFGVLVSRRQSKMRIDAAADSAHRSIAHHGQGRANVHSWQKTILRSAIQSGALIRKAYPLHSLVFDERCTHGRAGPDLQQARRGELLGHPLIELAEGHYETVVFLQKTWNEGKFECFITKAK